jgi:hypothetical protein
MREVDLMAIFTQQEHEILHNLQGITSNAGLQHVYNKLYNLHEGLYSRIRNYDLDLHPHWQKSAIISYRSAACTRENATLVLPYFRSHEQAQLVERLMGRESEEWSEDAAPYRHPVIELRLTPEHFAVELILSPYAWWDQQNFIGKLELARHRQTFHALLAQLDGDYRFGFWDGAHLSDMHLTAWELRHSTVFEEWMQTFADGQDWLRIGKWYAPEESQPNNDTILLELFDQVKNLNSLYTFLLWTSNNNFHSFYEKRQRPQRRLHA